MHVLVRTVLSEVRKCAILPPHHETVDRYPRRRQRRVHPRTARRHPLVPRAGAIRGSSCTTSTPNGSRPPRRSRAPPPAQRAPSPRWSPPSIGARRSTAPTTSSTSSRSACTRPPCATSRSRRVRPPPDHRRHDRHRRDLPRPADVPGARRHRRDMTECARTPGCSTTPTRWR